MLCHGLATPLLLVRPAAAAAAGGPSNCSSLLMLCDCRCSMMNTRPSDRLEVALRDGLESVAQVEVRHVTAEDRTGYTGEVVVQPRPDTGVDDFLAEVIRHVEMLHRVQVSGGSGGVEAVDIQVDLSGP